MRKAMSSIVVLVNCLAWASLGGAQSVEDIIDRHIKAIGGSKVLERTLTTFVSGSIVQWTDGRAGVFSRQTKRPNLLHTEISLGDAGWSEAYNGSSAWRRDGRDGIRTLIGDEGARLQAEALYRCDRFLTYKQEKTKALLLGRDRVRGSAAFVIELTSRAGVKRRVFFDATTYMILKEEQQTAAGTEVLMFDEYHALDGIMEPHKIEMQVGGRALQMVVERVTHNGAVSDEVFNYPESSGEPLPDVGELFVEAMRNQDRIDESVEHYTYTATETKKEIDKNGQIKVVETTVYQVFYLDGDPIRKLVKKNDRELNEKERREEDERIEKIIREHAKDKAEEAERRAKEERRRQEMIAKGKEPPPEKEDGDDFEIADFLRVSQFMNPRREQFHGRNVIVSDFGPKPNFRPRTRSENIVSKVVGVVWIDEKARRVARLDARFNNDLKFWGGFLASLQKGSGFVFEQDMVNNEAWLPSYREMNVSARVLLFKGLKMFATWQFSDYKKLTVESDYEISQPELD